MPKSLRVLLLLAPVVLIAIGAGPGAPDESRAVERAVLDYVEAIDEAKPEDIERSVHPELHKFGFARRSASDDYRALPMTSDALVELAATYNQRARIPPDAPKKVTVLDVLDQTAAVKLEASWGIDYMHLAKYDGTWKTVQVLWLTYPGR